DNYTAQDLRDIESLLKKHGALQIDAKDNGLYSAVTTNNDTAISSGYAYTWIRDTVAVSIHQMEIKRHDIAVKTLKTLETYFQKHKHRFIDIITGVSDKNDPMQRPHIRFDGDTLTEINQKWSHAQNDALGYALWLFATL